MPQPGRAPQTGKASQPGKVRIIGGRFRGTRLDVPASAGTRPTSDRVRETLFNWLAPHLPGASCIDLFAGSGALGFEAASRGAGKVLMIERDARAAGTLAAAAQRLGASEVEVRSHDAIAFLRAAPTQRYDIAFVDPPFDAQLHAAALRALDAWLAPHALVYIEAARTQTVEAPAGWTLHREGSTRDVRYRLLRAGPAPAP